MIVRHFIGKRLAEYYAQPAHLVVGSSDGIRLSRLMGEWHWRRVYGQLYREQQGQWLTPVELFRPYYSNILANFVAEQYGSDDGDAEVHIVELGGGRGTNAKCILSHLQQTHPCLYDRVTYTIIDSSQPLMDLQQEVLSSCDHSEKIDFAFQDLMDVAEEKATLLEESDVPTVVFAMELMDNLPHDKVRRNRVSRQFEQAEVQTDNSRPLEEVFVPLKDPLLSDLLTAAPAYGGTVLDRPAWVPTVSWGVLRNLSNVRPNSCLAFADFDYLPPPDLDHDGNMWKRQRSSTWAIGEPLVTSMDKTDFECYLDAPPFCDILFPTDFGKLASFAKTCWGNGKTVRTWKHPRFLERFGRKEVDDTKSWLTGYSPLIHDFGNCSVLSVTNAIDE